MYWIFAYGEYTDFSRGTKEALFKRLKKNRKWYIGHHTQNRNRIGRDDKIIFYQTGTGALKFVGNAVLESGLQPPENKQEYYPFVIISEPKLWKKELHVSEVDSLLSFQKNETPLQYYFQMAIRKITESDYKLLMKKAEC